MKVGLKLQINKSIQEWHLNMLERGCLHHLVLLSYLGCQVKSFQAPFPIPRACYFRDLQNQFVQSQTTHQKGYAWQSNFVQTLVEFPAKYQALKTAWQSYYFQALVEITSKCQALKTAWKGHFFEALVESLAKCQALKTAWQGHFFQRLDEITPK